MQSPAQLNGSHGSNRHDNKHCQISAETDWQAIQCWLNEFYDSPQTLRNYRKEAERLLLWSINQRGKALSD
ncbi:hypothetical protein A9R00_04690, partial [Oleispira antarctica]